MWATYAAVLVMLLASAAAGAAVLRLARREPWLGYGPAVGFSLLISVAAIATRLPGRAVTGAAATGLLALAGAVIAAPTLRGRKPPSAAALALAVAVLATAIPFVVAGNVGVLGVGVNNDMASHLAWADGLKVDPAERGLPIPPGYPIGPHALVASVSEATGIGVADASTALTLAISLLSVPAAWTLLSGLPPRRRALASVLVALPYLGAAYYAQGAFKETLQALLLLAFVAVLRELLAAGRLDRGGGALLAVIGAGFLYNYSYVGFLWPAAVLLAALALEVVVRGRRPRPAAAARAALGQLQGSPRVAFAAAGVALVAAALIVPELSRTVSFFRTVGVSPSDTGVIGTTNLGNLSGQISPLTALGIWPAEDFRSYFRELHNAYQAGLAGAVAVAGTLAAAFWWRRRDDMSIPAAAVGAAAIYVGVRLRGESPYLAAKALAVGAPIAMLFSLRSLLARWDTDAGDGRLAHAGLAVAFVALAAVSSFVALRSARVGPEERRAELTSLRPLVDGRYVLMLPYDDFARWELPRTTLAGPVLGIAGSGVRPEKGSDRDAPSDIDVLRPVELDKADFVISTSSHDRSEPPANFSLARRGRFFELWRRNGPTPDRQVLVAEGSASGATLDCGEPAGRRLAGTEGWARIAPAPVRPRSDYNGGKPFALPPGRSEWWSAEAAPGTYEVSLDYVAQRDVTLNVGGKTWTLPGTLDRLGNRWRIAKLRHPGGSMRLRTSAAGLPFGAHAQQTAIRGLSLVRLDAPRRLVPLREACGRHVDWYTLGRARPPLPARG